MIFPIRIWGLITFSRTWVIVAGGWIGQWSGCGIFKHFALNDRAGHRFAISARNIMIAGRANTGEFGGRGWLFIIANRLGRGGLLVTRGGRHSKLLLLSNAINIPQYRRATAVPEIIPIPNIIRKFHNSSKSLMIELCKPLYDNLLN